MWLIMPSALENKFQSEIMKLKNLLTAFLSMTVSGLILQSLSANTTLFDNGAADLSNPNETFGCDGGSMVGNVFTASAGGSANIVNFAGLYYSSNTLPTTDSFTLSLYSASGGTPSSLIGTSTLSGVSRSVIGTTLNEVNYLSQHLTVYQFGGTLDNPFTLTAGQSYYLGFTDYDSPSQGFDLAYSTGSATSLYQGMTGGNGNSASIGAQWSGKPLSFSVVSAVPEPSTYALFGLGVLVLVIAVRWRRAV